jgi:cytoskeletal protein CcmA (bactofilin family)
MPCSCPPEEKTVLATMLLVVLSAMLPVAAAARTGSDAPLRAASMTAHDLGTDRFVAGRSVRVVQPVAGDLVATGGTVGVDAAVSGDALVAGGTVRVDGSIEGSLYAGGGRITLDGTVRRNARIGGGRVEIDPKAVVTGNVSLAGGAIRIEGTVQGYVQAAGGSVVIDGTVGGDVVASAGSVELGPNARIAGKLRYASRELKRDPAAQVAGGVERSPVNVRSTGPGPRHLARAAGWLWTAGVVLTAIVLVAALPAFTARAASTLRARTGTSLLAGFVAMVCIPVAAILLLVTVIGIPLALLALVLYAALLLAGYAMTGIGIGDWALARWRAAQATRAGWRIVAAALSMVALALLGRVPWIGAPVSVLVLIAGVGALVMQARRADVTPSPSVRA